MLIGSYTYTDYIVFRRSHVNFKIAFYAFRVLPFTTSVFCYTISYSFIFSFGKKKKNRNPVWITN